MSARPRARWRTALTSLGGIALAAAAAWFGLDLGDSSPSGSANPDNPTGTAAAPRGSSGSESCPLGSLPPEADEVVGDILAGGPFEYPDNDGVRFGNYEGRLPQQGRDYYREYTVETPNLGHRGARRIVTGGPDAADPDVWYYTSDHYETFCEIPDAE
ncbi:ribonuclease [Corynebacterium mastitidis]|uniref:Ribonuclease n=1 Tax=Corynebacterium mastitidis TaxID=161890 RepID=A0A2N0X9R4_9CORY|nr:ribonuclease domain-containing protein [Corynebacterium mastitidis]MCH6197542.1 ribonuclease [Corynebacterium mastitidis]PKF69450.1 ribonuclease [Corynebacterium mastitidis]